jgi:hypothetical protein
MSERLRIIEQRQRRDVRLLFSVLGDSIENAFARHTTPGRPIMTLDRLRIMAEVDRSLAMIYGRYNGDPDAALTEIVVRDATAARFELLDASVTRWRAVMSLTLRERVEAEANRD